ncbi:MAG: hypothetical protein WD757_06925 [Actinomycetota bacterium]
MYRLRLSKPAERWLEDQPDHAYRVEVLDGIGALCEAAEDPIGARIPGFEPPAFLAFLGESDVAATYVVFHGTRDLLVLTLERRPDFL